VTLNKHFKGIFPYSSLGYHKYVESVIATIFLGNPGYTKCSTTMYDPFGGGRLWHFALYCRTDNCNEMTKMYSYKDGGNSGKKVRGNSRWTRWVSPVLPAVTTSREEAWATATNRNRRHSPRSRWRSLALGCPGHLHPACLGFSHLPHAVCTQCNVWHWCDV